MGTEHYSNCIPLEIDRGPHSVQWNDLAFCSYLNCEVLSEMNACLVRLAIINSLNWYLDINIHMADKYILPGSVLIRTTVTQTLQVCGTLLKHIPSFGVFDDDGFRDCCLTCCSTISCSSSAGLRSGLTNRTFIFQNPVNQTRVNILECMCKRKSHALQWFYPECTLLM